MVGMETSLLKLRSQSYSVSEVEYMSNQGKAECFVFRAGDVVFMVRRGMSSVGSASPREAVDMIKPY